MLVGRSALAPEPLPCCQPISLTRSNHLIRLYARWPRGDVAVSAIPCGVILHVMATLVLAKRR
jgi:hypothetical protein